MNRYQVAIKGGDPEITLRLSADMLKDLVKRSQENGRDINVEIAIRLARTLENDQRMVEEDHLLAFQCLQNMMQQDKSESD